MKLPAYIAHLPGTLPHPQPHLSVVIPAYNEAGRIEPYLNSIHAYFKRQTYPCQILVVNDGSSDGTAALIERLQTAIPQLDLLTYTVNRGKGHAVRMGMLAARGKFRLFADADGSTPIEELERLMKRLALSGAPIAIGSRARTGEGIRVRIKPHRYVIGQIFRLCRQLLLHVDVEDSQCGFKLFTDEAADALFPLAQIDGFSFDVEILHLAGLQQLAIEEVGVNWQDSSDSKVRLLIDPAKMLYEMWRVRRCVKKRLREFTQLQMSSDRS